MKPKVVLSCNVLKFFDFYGCFEVVIINPLYTFPQDQGNNIFVLSLEHGDNAAFLYRGSGSRAGKSKPPMLHLLPCQHHLPLRPLPPPP